MTGKTYLLEWHNYMRGKSWGKERKNAWRKGAFTNKDNERQTMQSRILIK